MCGITGFIDQKRQTSPADLEVIVRHMADSMPHRGPDDFGTWTDADAGIALGFRRLSIIDLSPAGHQPMISAGGRFIICYNGEVYNAEDLRHELGPFAPNWRGHSDTEVILEAFATWGIEQSVQKLIGMFAIALWEVDARRLWLVRDRLGIKPLYWAEMGSSFLFGSELRTLRAHPAFRSEIDRDAASLFLRHNYYPNPHTVFTGVRQLPPGHLLCLEPGRSPRIFPYWSLADVARQGSTNSFKGSEAEASTALDTLLRDAVKRRMVADVPLGAFLSGGYDSSTVVALMQSQSGRPVKTFSIGFHEAGYNEAEHAKAVARHLGTEHTELYVTADEAQSVIPRLPEIYDEPFADASQIPTYLVSALARQHVTVSLSGDGGDEVFAGYNRYSHASRFNDSMARIPASLRRAGAYLVNATPAVVWDGAARLIPDRHRPRALADKMQKLADIVAEDGDGFYRKLTSHWPEPDAIVIGATEPETVIVDPGVKDIVPGFIERMQFRDTLTYLPDDILTKVDRASMAVSLEARVPLLDHRVVAFAWSLPLDFKLQRGMSKRVLRSVLYRYVPPELVDRPKMGFGVPIDSWLRGPIRDWAEDLLSERSLKAGGVFRPEPIRRRWAEHLSGRRNWQHALWNVLMFEAWRRRWA
ncbi:MAG: asparagine synthase (glutamine-hydrolyzing) [Hyphomicrobiaceae bacterium]